MIDDRQEDAVTDQVDVGDYCRRVEEHLARVNHGHLVRVVGPGFEVARAWAIDGVPLGVVFRGIERKAERHRAGRSTRPLRLEFCEGDVRDEYEMWRRAVGVSASAQVGGHESAGLPAEGRRRTPAVGRALERAIDKLVRAAGRLDVPEQFREDTGAVLIDLVRLKDELRHARGDTRAHLMTEVEKLDARIAAVARRAAGTSLTDATAEATVELAPFRSRLAPEAWQRSLDASIDRLLRDRLGLPTLDIDAPPESAI